MNRYIYTLTPLGVIVILDRKLKRDFTRPDYTLRDAADVCRWLNAREGGYPI